MRLAHRVLILLACLVGSYTASAAPRPSIRFEAQSVVVEGITIGGTAVCFSAGHEAAAYALRLRTRAVSLRDDDRDGTVRLDLNAPVPGDSVWLAVDLTTGESVLAQPSGARVRIKPSLPPVVARRANGHAAALTQRGEVLQYWYVRPGVGAWYQTAEDGGEGDSDGHGNREAAVSLDTFAAVEGSPAVPDDVKRGDIVFAVDLFTFAVSELRVNE